MRFMYPGGELAVITAAVEPIAKVLHKLHLHGNFYVNDGLLSSIADAFLCFSRRLETQQEQPAPITSHGLAAFVSALMRLEVLRLPDLGSAIQHLSISSPFLRKLHLSRVLALETFSLKTPQLMCLQLEATPTRPLSLPGLTTALKSLQELRWLHLGHCILGHKEVQ